MKQRIQRVLQKAKAIDKHSKPVVPRVLGGAVQLYTRQTRHVHDEPPAVVVASLVHRRRAAEHHPGLVHSFRHRLGVRDGARHREPHQAAVHQAPA